jgi:cell division septal protein FtsQ
VTDDLPVRGGRVRRRSQRRASRGFSPRRALAALAMLAAAGLVWGAVASNAFDVRDDAVEVEGATLTGEAAVRTALALGDPAPNAFTLATDVLRERLLALPAVADAEVRVGLPGSLAVRVVEREPILAWKHDGRLLLVDADGRVIADAAAPGASAAAAAAKGLPVVDDRREGDVGPAVGAPVDALELDVATRLLSLRPADVGSTAPALRVILGDEDGWTIRPAVEEPWTAVFGFYGPEIRPPTMIPEQVRLLRSLLLDSRVNLERVVRVILAGERAGTVIERDEP